MQFNAPQLQQANKKLERTVERLAHASLFEQCAERSLTWWPERGIGYYPVETGAEPYDAAYFERFARQADSDIGRALMQARCDLVDKFCWGEIIDIGIGSGAFIEAMQDRCYRMVRGYDVNPLGVAWLKERGLFCDPYKETTDVICLWDVLEHIEDFRPLLARVSGYVFISIPIFIDAAHVLRSKHYRKDEHFWYFTAEGLVRMMNDLGFVCLEQNKMETALGREDIGSFVFARI